MKTQQFGRFIKFFNSFSTTGKSVNKYIENVKKKNSLTNANIFQKNLKGKTKALLIEYPMSQPTLFKSKNSLIIFKPDSSHIVKSYSNFKETSKRIYSTTTNSYKNGIPFKNDWVTKLFIDNKFYKVYSNKIK